MTRPTKPLEELAAPPSRDEFWSRIVPAERPVVFRGAADRWEVLRPPGRAGEDALLDHLTKLVGDRLVHFGIGLPADEGFMGYADVADGFGSNVAHHRRKFSWFARELVRESANPTGHYVYAHSVAVATDMPELLPMLDVPILRGETPKGGHWRLWLSSGGHILNTHFDAFQNLVFVLHGTKRYTLFPPEEYTNLYPGPFDEGPFRATVSMVHPRRPDAARYPRYATALAAAAHVELAAGDVLFLPAHWWHTVETPGCTIAANYWWGHTEPERRLAKSVLLQALLHLRHLPDYQRRFWRSALDYYVFQTDGPPHESTDSPLDLTGRATPERTAGIRRMLATIERTDSERVDPDALTSADPLRLSPHMAVELGPGGAIQLVLAGARTAPISKHDLDVLLQFRLPARAADAAEALARDGYELDEGEVMAVVRQFARLGCLVRAVGA